MFGWRRKASVPFYTSANLDRTPAAGDAAALVEEAAGASAEVLGTFEPAPPVAPSMPVNLEVKQIVESTAGLALALARKTNPDGFKRVIERYGVDAIITATERLNRELETMRTTIGQKDTEIRTLTANKDREIGDAAASVAALTVERDALREEVARTSRNRNAARGNLEGATRAMVIKDAELRRLNEELRAARASLTASTAAVAGGAPSAAAAPAGGAARPTAAGGISVSGAARTVAAGGSGLRVASPTASAGAAATPAGGVPRPKAAAAPAPSSLATSLARRAVPGSTIPISGTFGGVNPLAVARGLTAVSATTTPGIAAAPPAATEISDLILPSIKQHYLRDFTGTTYQELISYLKENPTSVGDKLKVLSIGLGFRPAGVPTVESLVQKLEAKYPPTLAGGARRRRQTHHRRRHQKKTHKRHVRFA